MRKLLPIFLTCFAFLAVNACAGGDDEDAADAAPATPDADLTPDAMPGNPPVTSGVGEICNPTGGMCTSMATPGCLTFTMGATEGICTLQCASGIADEAFPDAAASQMCATNYTGTTGTPLCVVEIAASAGPPPNRNFACGIACGMVGDPAQDLGGCPGGLTCNQNLCTP